MDASRANIVNPRKPGHWLASMASTSGKVPVYDLVEADLWDQLPTDLSALLAFLPQADRYLQDEIQVAFHPTLTRIWSRHRSTWATNAMRHRAITGIRLRRWPGGLARWLGGWPSGAWTDS